MPDNTPLVQCLRKLDMLVTGNLLDTQNTDITSKGNEIFYQILESAKYYQADYVYIRRFSDGRPAVPQIYIYDNTKRAWPQEAFSNIHKRLWNAGIVPLFYVINTASLDIFSCARKADFLNSKGQMVYHPADSIKWVALAEADRKRLSGLSIDDGTFWENSQNAKYLNRNKSAHESLIYAINELDFQLQHNSNIPSDIARRLLILCILVKYLEDRNVFPKNYFELFKNDANSFFEILYDVEATLRFFDALKTHFQGDIFILSHDEKEAMTQEVLNEFSVLVEGKTLKSQLYFWRLYSFEDIPVQLVSYIYQNFVNTPGAVYTPNILVDLMVNEVMPTKALSDEFRVLDPSCGSGVFLVRAFKQHIWAWRHRNKWQKPDIETLKGILRSNIFGVDIDPAAVELTVFSLNLAICDTLQPDVIWNDLKFDKLKNKNIYSCDFFENNDLHKKYFDLIIGNPPFVSKLKTDGSREINTLLCNKYKRTLPDNNLAYLFLEYGFEFLKNEGKICLILPSGIIYNVNTQNYKKHLFSNYRPIEVLDFISIRGLFCADVKICVLIMENSCPNDTDSLTHVLFRRSNSAAEHLGFEIDHYDVHQIPINVARNVKYIWRANLFGGERFGAILKKIEEVPSLSEYLDEIGASCIEGFIGSDTGKEADFITDMPYLPTDAFSENIIPYEKIVKCEQKYFASPRTPDRYSSPMVLIKEHANLPIAYWDQGPLVFRHSIISITGISKNKLKSIRDRFLSFHDDYRFFLALLSSRMITCKATSVLKDDIDSLPYPKNPDDISLSESERVLRDDTLNYLIDYIRLGQTSVLTKTEASVDDLNNYSSIYCKFLSAAFGQLHAAEYFELDNLICFPFYFGEKPHIQLREHQEINQYLRELCLDKIGYSVQIVRLVRLYDQNVIFQIKPKSLRYWLQSAAIRDADETFSDLICEEM